MSGHLTSPMTRSHTRREFLGATSVAAAATFLGTRPLFATSVALPIRSALPVNAFLATTTDASDLQVIATRAVDAAKSAGAMYADVRVAERYMLQAEQDRVIMQTEFAYGIRVLSDGAWGFVHAREPRLDAVAGYAQEAVAVARTNARVPSERRAGTSIPEWTPAPVVTGEWRTPVDVDPFAIPVQQHAELNQAMASIVDRFPNINHGTQGALYSRWDKETRVFASTTGSLVTQHFARALPKMGSAARYGNTSVNVCVPSLHGQSCGYEVLLAPDLADQIKAGCEDAMRLARLPRRSIDVGRYPIVFDGSMMGEFLLRIIGPGMELDRAAGSGNVMEGTSVFTLGRLGTAIASPLMTVRGTRILPSITAAQWDDDGTVPIEHTIIDAGRLQDYHTSGECAAMMTSWYGKRHRSVRSNGCSVAPTAAQESSVRPLHLTMTPHPARMSLEDLYRNIDRGIAVFGQGALQTDQQFGSGSMTTNNVMTELYEVSRGKLVSRLWDMGLQFNTLAFTNALSAVGDTTTMRTVDTKLQKGMPWTESVHSATAPAGFFKDVNLISTRRI